MRSSQFLKNIILFLLKKEQGHFTEKIQQEFLAHAPGGVAGVRLDAWQGLLLAHRARALLASAGDFQVVLPAA